MKWNLNVIYIVTWPLSCHSKESGLFRCRHPPPRRPSVHLGWNFLLFCHMPCGFWLWAMRIIVTCDSVLSWSIQSSSCCEVHTVNIDEESISRSIELFTARPLLFLSSSTPSFSDLIPFLWIVQPSHTNATDYRPNKTIALPPMVLKSIGFGLVLRCDWGMAGNPCWEKQMNAWN